MMPIGVEHRVMAVEEAHLEERRGVGSDIQRGLARQEVQDAGARDHREKGPRRLGWQRPALGKAHHRVGDGHEEAGDDEGDEPILLMRDQAVNRQRQEHQDDEQGVAAHGRDARGKRQEDAPAGGQQQMRPRPSQLA